MTARYIVGDSLSVIRTLPDASVDLVLTSPPFLALRSYLPADHPDKTKEIGSEPTPGAFIDTLLEHTEEWRRVLAPHGSICVELGDTYSGSGGAGGDYNEGGLRDGQNAFTGSARVNRGGMGGRPSMVDGATGGHHNGGYGWPLDKSLCLIPELFRIALVYGFNPLTGRQTQRWRARNVVRWCRPNPPVGALADKFRPGTSDMVIACESRKRYFDLDAVRTMTDRDDLGGLRQGTPKGTDERRAANGERANMTGSNPAGAPPLDWWQVSTEPYKGSHYATWPTALLIRPILAMCPQRVCLECGKPSERITAVAYQPLEHGRQNEPKGSRFGANSGPGGGNAQHMEQGRASRLTETTGWTDCGHNDWRPGVVLDPFAGSGTTLAVATGHGRDAIGVDLDERNALLAAERVGMFLTVEERVA